MIKITLDTSCYNMKFSDQMEKLVKLHKENKINVYAPLETYMETMEYKGDRQKLLKYLSWLMAFDNKDWYAQVIPDDKTPEDVLDFDEKEHENYMKKVREIHTREYKDLKSISKILEHLEKKGVDTKKFRETVLNKYTDWMIFMNAIKNDCDYFITDNKRDFINRGKEAGVKQRKFKKEFGIKVREANDAFIRALKKSIR